MLSFDTLRLLDFKKAFAITAFHFNELETDFAKKRFLRMIQNRFFMQCDNFDDSQRSIDAVIVAIKTLSPRRLDYNAHYGELINEISRQHKVKNIINYEVHHPQCNQARLLFFRNNLWMNRVIPHSWPLDLRRACFAQLQHALYIYYNFIYPSSHRLIVSFSDMQTIDNIILQLENLRGVTTCTLQHGLYVDYEEFKTINSVNYICSVASNFLAWGLNTASLINKYHDNKQIYICGKPGPLSRHHSHDELKNQKQVKVVRAIAVIVCDQELFRDINFSMISIAIQLWGRSNVHIRNHPQNKRSEYLSKFKLDDICLKLKDYTFVIGHSSSLIYESIEERLNVCQYMSAAKKIMLPHPLQFRNKEELMIACDHSPKICSTLKKNFISCSGPESLGRYQAAIHNILGPG